VSVASRPSTRASKLPVTKLVFVARGAFPRSTPCVCALRGFLPRRVFPDRTTRRHGLARPPPNWVGWAERVVTCSRKFFSVSCPETGCHERLTQDFSRELQELSVPVRAFVLVCARFWPMPSAAQATEGLSISTIRFLIFLVFPLTASNIDCERYALKVQIDRSEAPD